jgi:hypothetical protein
MPDRSTLHQVAYYSQWESPDLVTEFIAGTRPVRDDPPCGRSPALPTLRKVAPSSGRPGR